MVDISQNKSVEVTLEDDAWKDSFDKLLDPRPVLRELNVIKKNVRASFNLDSSIENCTGEGSGFLAVPTAPVELNDKLRSINNRNAGSISTPVVKRVNDLRPFKCSLSPIGLWKFHYFDKKDTRKTLPNIDEHFQATPIELNLNSVPDYEEELPASPAQKESHSITFELPKRLSKKRKTQEVPEINVIDAELNSVRLSEPQVTEQNVELRRTSVNTKKSKPKPKRTVAFQTLVHTSIIEIDFTPEKPKRRPQSTRNRRKKSSTQKTCKETNSELSFCTVSQTDKDQPGDYTITLRPGKWRKSLNIWRRTCEVEGRKSTNPRLPSIANESVVCVGVLRLLGERKSVHLKAERQSDFHSEQNWEQRVLKYCEQIEPLPFADCYNMEKMKKCRKIGEGVYGEVFTYASQIRRSADVVIKVIPIEGTMKINGEVQKTYEQILPEIAITTELSNLKDAERQTNATKGFVNIRKVACVNGKYPEHLIKLWEEFDDDKGSENDHPNVFQPSQLYIVLELDFSGKDMEAFVFDNARQSYYALRQVILTLAVAEEAYQFEHRDLHWGNILIDVTRSKQFTYKLQGETYALPTGGIKTTIIDYTLSRMTYNDCCLYNDLSVDEELFTATGDYQFDIYRMMKDLLQNNWESYKPKTNVFWISYIINKMINGVSYRNVQSKIHTNYLDKLKELEGIVLTFHSATECAKYLQNTG